MYKVYVYIYVARQGLVLQIYHHEDAISAFYLLNLDGSTFPLVYHDRCIDSIHLSCRCIDPIDLSWRCIDSIDLSCRCIDSIDLHVDV